MGHVNDGWVLHEPVGRRCAGAVAQAIVCLLVDGVGVLQVAVHAVLLCVSSRGGLVMHVVSSTYVVVLEPDRAPRWSCHG